MSVPTFKNQNSYDVLKYDDNRNFNLQKKKCIAQELVKFYSFLSLKNGHNFLYLDLDLVTFSLNMFFLFFCLFFCFPVHSLSQAKLPRGIHQVRPHLKNIDNVPLLVPLFTDCTPDSESSSCAVYTPPKKKNLVFRGQM